jgi:hypothetical protein
MGNKNRARSRAVRAEMARTGDTYTRAAAAVGDTPAGPDGRSRTDVVVDHARRCLRALLDANQAQRGRAEELERAGRRIVDGGQVSRESWEIRDWRTGELIAGGDDGIDGYDATADRLDPDGTWFHRDHLYEEWPAVSTPELPPSLCQVIEEWIDAPGTPDEDIAEFVGWSVKKVREHRQETR